MDYSRCVSPEPGGAIPRYKVEALREINPADPTGPPSYQVFLVIDMELRPAQPQGVTIVTFSSYMPTAEYEANAMAARLNESIGKSFSESIPFAPTEATWKLLWQLATAAPKGLWPFVGMLSADAP